VNETSPSPSALLPQTPGPSITPVGRPQRTPECNPPDTYGGVALTFDGNKGWYDAKCRDANANTWPGPNAFCMDKHTVAPGRIICVTENCTDVAESCEESMCANEKMRATCSQTCGVCEPYPCLYAGNETILALEPEHLLYRHGEVANATCATNPLQERQTEVTCNRGTWEAAEAICDKIGEVKEDPDMECVDDWPECPQFASDCGLTPFRYQCRNTCMESCIHKRTNGTDVSIGTNATTATV